jgi:hypothetical protein
MTDDDGPDYGMQQAAEAMEWYETHQPMFGTQATAAPSEENGNGIH